MARLRLAAAVAVLAFAVNPALAGTPHRDREHQFRLEIPDGWDTTTASAVAALNGNVFRLTKQSVHFTVCFVPKGRTSSDLPRILIQWEKWPEPPPNYEVIDDALSRELPGALKRTESSLPIKLQSLDTGGHFIDRAKNRIVMRLRASVPGSGIVDAVSFGMLGQKGTALVHCYASSDKFKATLPMFERVANSFRFDAGLEYKPDPNAPAGAEWSPGRTADGNQTSGSSVNWGGFRIGGMRGALIGGVIGGIIAAGLWLMKRFSG